MQNTKYLISPGCSFNASKKPSKITGDVRVVNNYVNTCPLGWSDLGPFAIFEKRQVSVDQVRENFYDLNSRKSANMAACAQVKFSFSKNHRDLKN